MLENLRQVEDALKEADSKEEQERLERAEENLFNFE